MKRWKIISEKFESSNFDRDKLKDEIINTLLANRGIKTKKQIDEFLNPDLSRVTPKDVEINTTDLNKSVDRIKKAIKEKEGIMIFGDYDVDGICGTAILWESLYSLYKNVFPYIPGRVEEGYGLSVAGIDNVLKMYPDTKLIITVDNGIVAYKALEYAGKLGIDVIVTDHHVKGEKKLPTKFLVHTTKLCGAGVAYLLSQSFENQKEDSHLELVALATIADLVPLLGANRVLVKYGLGALRKTKRTGLLSLFNQAGIAKEEIGVYQVGYIIGPRLNAMGRLASAMDSLRLICTKNNKKGSYFAINLNTTNKERQDLTEEITTHAKSNYSQDLPSKIIFVRHESYNQGVIGLVASRLVEAYYKPSFVLSVGDKYSKGSARSVSGVNIIELIRSVGGDLLVEAGGHPMAAGFTVETTKIDRFRKELEKQAEKFIQAEHLERLVNIDLKLELTDINIGLYEQIQRLAPFGIGNFEPVFATYGVLVDSIRFVGNGKHLKLTISSEEKDDKVSFSAIAFGMGESLGDSIHTGDKIDIAYQIDKDTWNGNKKLQLKIKDVRL